MNETHERMGKIAGTNRFEDHGVTYEQRWAHCSNPRCKKCANAKLPSDRHGPYWYMLAMLGKRRWTVYIGKRLDTTLYRRQDGTFDYDAYKNREKKQSRTSGQTPSDSQPVPQLVLGMPGHQDTTRQAADGQPEAYPVNAQLDQQQNVPRQLHQQGTITTPMGYAG